MNNALMTKFINKHKRTDIPEFRPGDTIRVHVKIKEGDKERLQAFEGTLIARNNTGMGETITVRKVSFSHGVERIFPLHARVIDHIDVVRTGKVRRAKLYYLRGLRGKAARLKELHRRAEHPCPSALLGRLRNLLGPERLNHVQKRLEVALGHNDYLAPNGHFGQ